MPGSALRNLAMFRKLIGDHALRNVTVVTTMWSQIDQIMGAERERELVNTPKFWGTMVSRGSSVARFDGTREGAFSIIHSQLNKTTRTLNIQKEMIDITFSYQTLKLEKKSLRASRISSLSIRKR
jgi:hypothetical protein